MLPLSGTSLYELNSFRVRFIDPAPADLGTGCIKGCKVALKSYQVNKATC